MNFYLLIAELIICQIKQPFAMLTCKYFPTLLVLFAYTFLLCCTLFTGIYWIYQSYFYILYFMSHIELSSLWDLKILLLFPLAVLWILFILNICFIWNLVWATHITFFIELSHFKNNTYWILLPLFLFLYPYAFPSFFPLLSPHSNGHIGDDVTARAWPTYPGGH